MKQLQVKEEQLDSLIKTSAQCEIAIRGVQDTLLDCKRKNQYLSCEAIKQIVSILFLLIS